MALQSSDLLLVGRGGVSYYTTAEEIATYVQGSDALTYRGTVDLTAAIGAQLDPNPPVVGDVYLSSTAGTIDGEWSITETDTAVGDRVFYNGSAWQLISSGAQDVGVTGVGVQAPITDTGTASVPVLGISHASESARGSVQLAKAVYDGGGLISTDSNSDVLIGAHFDELAGRIAVAAGGGIQAVQGANGLSASVTTGTATVSGIDAEVGVVGVTSLTNTIAEVENQAATPKAVHDYAVPMDLSTLDPLPA